jgi:hypothetical protein
MNEIKRYDIFFTDGSQLTTSLCKLRMSVDGKFLYEEDPSSYGEGIIRTFVMANVKYWEPVK